MFFAVNANYQDAIVSKDSLKIVEGTINIHAEDDGIHADIALTINGGYLYVNASGDGLDANGTITMNNGTVTGENTDGLRTNVEYTDGTIVMEFTMDDTIAYLNESSVTTASKDGMMGAMEVSIKME